MSRLRGRRRPGSDANKAQHIAMDVSGRTPPHNSDAEAAVLSTVMFDGRSLDEILDVLPDGEPFYFDAHRRIYEVAVDLHSRGVAVDFATVADEIKKRDRLQAIGGLAYLVKIIDATPAVANVRAHAQIVRDTHRVRQLIERCQLTVAEAFGDYGSAQEIVEKHEQKVFELGRSEQRSEVQPIAAVAVRVAEAVRRAHEGPGGITGYPAGFSRVDERTGGFHPSDFTIIAARPGMGKTSYALAIAQHLASANAGPDHDGYLVAIWSLEMPDEQLVTRLACMSAGVEVSRVRRGKLGNHFGPFLQHLEVARGLPIFIDESNGITVMDVRAKVRRLQREHPRRKVAVLIDYLQLMRGPDGVEREQAVGEISRGLKALAKELRIPVIALSQLNRDVDKRAAKDRRPVLSDLRESGSLEQDADVIQFIYRPEYYRKLAGEDVPEEERGLAEIITAKQRNGSTGPDMVAFREASTRFENASPSDLDRWGLSAQAPEAAQPKMFAPGSRLPGASANEN